MTDAHTFKIGDRVRVARDTIYGAKKGAEFTITYISNPLKPEGAYASGEGFPGGVWLTDLELVQAAKPSPVELSEYDKELLEEIRQAATEKSLGVHLGTPDSFRRDRLIAHIADQDAVIRRRNETIERQKAQLAEYAAQLESRFDPEVFPFRPLRDLQKRIGEANAAKGFHAEGERLRKETGAAERVAAASNDNGDGFAHYRKEAREKALAGAAADLRNYATARLALITTEVAEAIEEIRNGRQVDETYYNESSYPNVSIEKGAAVRKPEGVPSELADVVIRAFDFAHEFGIDLAAMIEEKLAFNATRAHKHGKEF